MDVNLFYKQCDNGVLKSIPDDINMCILDHGLFRADTLGHMNVVNLILDKYMNLPYIKEIKLPYNIPDERFDVVRDLVQKGIIISPERFDFMCTHDQIHSLRTIIECNPSSYRRWYNNGWVKACKLNSLNVIEYMLQNHYTYCARKHISRTNIIGLLNRTPTYAYLKWLRDACATEYQRMLFDQFEANKKTYAEALDVYFPTVLSVFIVEYIPIN